MNPVLKKKFHILMVHVNINESIRIYFRRKFLPIIDHTSMKIMKWKILR